MTAQRDWAAVVAGGRCPDCELDLAGLDRTDLPGALEAEGAAWHRLLAAAAPDALRAHAEGVWSPLEYAGHVRDVLGVFADRVERALVEDDPALGWWDHERAAVDDRYNEQEPGRVAVELHAAASRLAGVVDGLRPSEWGRPARRRAGEAFTVEGLVRFALHEAHHHRADASRPSNAGDPS